MPRRSLQVVSQPPSTATSRVDSPRDRARRIVPDRVGKAIKAVRHLQQLANPAVYDIKPVEAERIVTTLQDAVDTLDYSLKNPGKVVTPVIFEDDE